MKIYHLAPVAIASQISLFRLLSSRHHWIVIETLHSRVGGAIIWHHKLPVLVLPLLALPVVAATIVLWPSIIVPIKRNTTGNALTAQQEIIITP
jgi:hypothetical protein